MQSQFTESKRILRSILKFSQLKKIKLYIVGGFIRDIILGRSRKNPDIDFAVARNAIRFAAGLAKQLKSGFVVLDKKNGCARLVKKKEGTVYTLDFTDFRGRDLLDDLAKRDFSINSLAVELGPFLKNSNSGLIDPYEGLKDIKSRIIRMVGLRAFDDDPLRILRTFSLSCMLDFKIAPKTLALARRKKNKLRRVSFERIRDELFKILSSPNGYNFLAQLDSYGVLEIIIPEIKPMKRLKQGPYHHLDVWKHTLETMRHLERIFRSFNRNKDIRDYLGQEFPSGHGRRELIRMGAFMHDIGKPKALRIEKGKLKFYGHEHIGARMLSEVTRRLKLSNNESYILKRMVTLHLRPGYLADNAALTQRARFRFFRDAGEEAISVLLISLADQRATKGFLTTEESRRRHERLIRRLIKEYFQNKKEKKIPRLINGHDLIKKFKLAPSPLIGKILAEIEELQAIGKIKTKQQAFSSAKKLIT